MRLSPSTTGVSKLFGDSCDIRLLLFILLVAVFPTDVFAQAAENNLTSGMMNRYKDIMTGVSAQIVVLASYTFWALATVELCYSLGMKALGGGDPGDILRSFIKRLLFIGFWGYMLTNATNIIDWIINTMVVFASQASMPATFTPSISVPVVSGSAGAVLNPDNIVDKGIQVVVDTIRILPGGIAEIPTAISMLFAAVFVFIAMLVIAAFMALALLEVYIVGYGGVFLLALGPNRHTNGYAQAYLRYLMAVGIKIFAIALIAAIAEVVMAEQINAMVGNNAGQIWSTVAVAGILMILAAKAPNAIVGAIQGITDSKAPTTAGSLTKGGAAAFAGTAGGGMAIYSTGAAAGISAASSANSARAGGAGAGLTAARALAGGLAGTGSAIAGAAKEGMKESVMGRSGGSPFPRGGTAGGRMAARIAEHSKQQAKATGK